MQPTVSVVLPVYNCPDYVGQAIDCMLAQSYTNFELIVIDDGSTDETPGILSRYSDPRMQVFTQRNCGLAGTLNRGISLARGRYIARQDQDDVSFPTRLERQVAFLNAHSSCALVGTWAEIWRENEKTGRVHAHPDGNDRLKLELLLNNPFVHSSVMIRKDVLDRVGAYCTDRSRQPPEDFELWSRIAREHEIANIPQILHAYREVEGSMSRAGPSPFVDHLVKICAENISWAAGSSTVDPQATNIAALAHNAPHLLQGVPDFPAMRDLFRRATTRITKDGQLIRDAESRLTTLRYRFWENRYGVGWKRHIFQAARSAVRLLRAI